jgi:hypothetical protein
MSREISSSFPNPNIEDILEPEAKCGRIPKAYSILSNEISVSTA